MTDTVLKPSLAGEGWVRRNKMILFCKWLFSLPLKIKRIRNKRIYFNASSPKPSQQLLLHCSTYQHPCRHPAREGLRAESNTLSSELGCLRPPIRELQIQPLMILLFKSYNKF